MKKVVYIGNRPKVLESIITNNRLKLVKAFIINQPLINDRVGFNIERLSSKGQKKYLVDSLLNLDFDICVSAGCSYILPMDTLNPEKIYINCHPSVLPLGKGKHPLNECFLSGKNIAGVTIHLLVNELDAGDILNQISFELTEDVDLSLLYGFIFDLEAELLGETINNLLDNNMTYNSTPQTGIETYYSRESEIRKFNAHEISTQKIINNSRAFSASNLGVILIFKDIQLIVFSIQEIKNEFIIKRYENVNSGTLIFINNDVALMKISDGIVKATKFKVHN
jgi:methionyl-tRNA formyltransferase